jgi:ribosomal protein L11 methyltransferase
MIKQWKKITLENLNKDPELLLPDLYDRGALGLEQNAESITVYFPESTDVVELNKFITEKMQKYKLTGSVKAATLKAENWHLAWKDNFQPIRISDKIEILPAWIPKTENADITIKINPGMAFGTGTHATTQIALRLLEKHIRQEWKLLDAGCGSGILTIAALKLGARYVEAWDISAGVKGNFEEHIKLNNVENNYSLEIGDVTERNKYPYDMILSNIQKNVNIKLLQRTIATDYRGLILFTGLLKEEEEEFRRKLEQSNKQIIDEMEIQEWIGLIAN